MKKASVLGLIVVASLAHVLIASAQFPCPLVQFRRLEKNTPISLSPLMYTYLATYPDLITAVIGARDAWRVTNAVERLGGWTGHVPDEHGSECPASQPPFQLGAFDFKDVNAFMNCATTSAYTRAGILNSDSVAFTDYFSNDFFLGLREVVWVKTGG
ncbi:MAG TPA: hypothetical protein VK548_07845 [Candidatus Acidoferrum sp.]|nr:hypothetical protein [Candidatus Acidoferrum sp.]